MSKRPRETDNNHDSSPSTRVELENHVPRPHLYVSEHTNASVLNPLHVPGTSIVSIHAPQDSDSTSQPQENLNTSPTTPTTPVSVTLNTEPDVGCSRSLPFSGISSAPEISATLKLPASLIHGGVSVHSSSENIESGIDNVQASKNTSEGVHSGMAALQPEISSLSSANLTSRPLRTNEVCSTEISSSLSSCDPVQYIDASPFDITGTLEPDIFFDATIIIQEEDPCQDANQEECFNNTSSMPLETEQFNVAFDGETQNLYEQSDDPPLYKGAHISVAEAAIALLSFILGCKISGETLSHTLALINLLLPKDNIFFKSVHNFNKFFENIKKPVNFIYYCSVCFNSLQDKSSVCAKCGPETKVSFYLHLPIIDQLRELYARPGFVDLLSHRFNRSKKVPDNLEDIYDGELYKSVTGVLSGLFDITLMWFTDGLSIYKSSRFQIWPVFFAINELPPHLRHKSENLILAGLAFGYEKPNTNILLKPIYEEIKILEKGVNVTIPGFDGPQSVQCLLLCGSCDSPAKSTFMRTTYFNGFYGCTRCLAKGEKSDESENVFVYPLEENIELRTKDQYEEHMRTQSFGVKGPTYLFWMVWSFFMTSTAIDVMHCVYLGLCRQIFSIWFSPEFIKQVFGQDADKKNMKEMLSKLLCSFKVPHYLDRPPRSLNDYCYFKAAEFRVWLYSTALPVLEQYMKEPYFSHFKKLVCGVALLNQSSVSFADVDLAKQLISDFVREWQQLFGLRHMSFNLHCLLHLPDVVLSMGPLWVTSCFRFENINGVLARLVHGTRYAGMQIQANLGLLRNLPTLISSLKASDVKNFCTLVMSGRKRLAVTENLGPRLFIIGNVIKNHCVSPKFSGIINRPVFEQSNLRFFFRLKKDNFLYVSRDYCRGDRDSTAVMYKFQGQELYGTVHFFLKLSGCNCQQMCNHSVHHYAFIQRFNWSYAFSVENPRATIKHILKCDEGNDVDVIPITDLECVCTKMCLKSAIFISVPLNYYELE